LSSRLQLGGNPQIIKQFQLRFPEPLKNVLDFLCAEHFHMNAHRFIVALISDALTVALEDYLNTRTQNGLEHTDA